MDSKNRHWRWGLAALALALFACGGSQPEKKGDWLDTLQPVNPGAEPELGDDDDDDDDEVAKEKPKQPPKSPPIKLRKSSGRPMVLIGPSKSISETFGATPGSVLKLAAAGGNIVLRIPEFALNAGYNIEFKTSGSGVKPKGTPVGSVVSLTIVLGGKSKPKAVPTGGPDYEIVLPLQGKESLNLAVATVDPDDTNKVEWVVYAPKRVDTGLGEAHFALKTLGPIMYLHGTLAEPTGAEAAAPTE